MLSPGKYHERVPRTLHENLVFRRKILDLARDDRDVRKKLREYCKRDILFFINTFVWQFNPTMQSRGDNSAVHPFITFPAQERMLVARPETHAEFAPHHRGFLWCYEHDRTMAVQKSRFQGASWLFQMAQAWLGAFHEFVQALNISRNEDAVDDGTKDSLFWKMAYLLDRCPEWLLGGRYNRSKLYFEFPATESEITGTATTEAAGVGGRASVIFVDEFPRIQKGQQVREGTALTANCRVFNGTHQGVGTPFEVMCNPKKSPEIVQFTLHWTENPQQNAGMYEYNPQNPLVPIIHDKNYKYPRDFKFVLDGTPVGGPRPGVRSPWYDQKCIDIGDEQAIASELDISPEGSAKQFFNGLKIRNLITSHARSPVWVGELDYDPAGRFRGMVEVENGRLRLWTRPVTDGHQLVRSRYVVGSDIAAGTGATPSCAVIIDALQGCKIGEYSNPFIEERPFAQFVVAMASWLADSDGGGAKLIWDSSGQQGVKFEKEVLSLGYRNIYYNEDELKHLRKPGRVRRPGWYSSNEQKYDVLKDLRASLFCGDYIERSEPCLLEMLLFEWDAKTGVVQHSGETRTNDPTGARKNHGDLVTATAIAWMLAKEYRTGGRQAPPDLSKVQPNSIGWLLEHDRLRQDRIEELGPAY